MNSLLKNSQNNTSILNMTTIHITNELNFKYILNTS